MTTKRAKWLRVLRAKGLCPPGGPAVCAKTGNMLRRLRRAYTGEVTAPPSLTDSVRIGARHVRK
jgi:hypothetical protein